jgi:phosphoribosylformimino-5-aminoimidazole carboxamide ribotide isomerase
LIVLPAVDLRGGRCVRLRQGDYADETVYDDDPVAVAKAMEAAGAEMIHVVDLDAARAQGSNREVVVAIAKAVAVPVQTGGGVRDDTLLRAGIRRVVLGSVAVSQPEVARDLAASNPGRVVVGLDHRDGEVRVRGWEEGSGLDLRDAVERLAFPGVAAFVVTNIAVDGMLTGPDLSGYADLLAATDVPIVASGGVGSLDDLKALAALDVDGRRPEGVIVGKALYEGRFTLEEAIAACAQ